MKLKGFQDILNDFDDTKDCNYQHPLQCLKQKNNPFAHKAVNIIESCLDAYPSMHLSGILKRLSSKQEDHYHSALFEIILHKAFINSGATVEIELKQDTNTSPDFIIKFDDGSEYLVELRNVMGYLKKDQLQRRKQLIKKKIRESIVKLGLKNICVKIDFSAVVLNNLSIKKLLKCINNNISNINSSHTLCSPMIFKYESSKSKADIKFKAFNYLVSNDQICHDEVVVEDDCDIIFDRNTSSRDIKNALQKKRKQHNPGDRPYIIALNMYTPFSADPDELDAIIGQEVYKWIKFVDQQGLPKSSGFLTRNNDGFFNESKKRNSRVSGVWIFRTLDAWNLSRGYTMYLNPSANLKISSGLFNKVPVVEFNNGMISRKEGVNFINLLGFVDP